MLSIIVAIARDGAIGAGGDQPFYIPEDLRRFKKLTTGHPIIMGRRTFEALPLGPLPRRLNIVVTRNAENIPAAHRSNPLLRVVSSLEDAITLAENTVADGLEFQLDNSEIFVIGGGEIYRRALPLASRLYVTEIDADVPDADTFFPSIPADFRPVEVSETISHTESADPLTGIADTNPALPPYRYITYVR